MPPNRRYFEWHSKKAPREQQNDGITAFTLHPLQVEQQTLRVGQPRTTRSAHRTSQVIYGQLHVVNAAVPLSTGTTPAQSSWDDACERIDYDFPSVRTPLYQHNPTLELLESSSRGTSPTDDALRWLNKDLPIAPVLPELEPPDAETWGPPIYPLKARPHHDELFYELDASYCLPPQASKNVLQLPLDPQEARSQPYQNGASHITVHELPGDIASSALYHPKPTNLTLLTRRSYLLQHGTEAQLAILDAWQDVENAQERPDTATGSRLHSPVSREVASGATLFPVGGKQEVQETPVYSQYTKLRKWDFEEVEEAYNKAVNGLTTPPPPLPARYSGGVEWFYGLVNQR